MKRYRYISTLLFVIFAITTLSRLSFGLLCDCEGHTHTEVAVCNIQHQHDSDRSCQRESSVGHCCGLHTSDELLFDAQFTQQNKREITPNGAYLLCNISSDDTTSYDLNGHKRRYSDISHIISSQWHTPTLRQRPPPVLA